MSEDHLIQDDIVDFYEALYSTDLNTFILSYATATSCVIPPDRIGALVTPLLRKEVVHVVYSFKPFKALSPDGIHPFFYQKYLHLVGDSVFNFCEQVFSNYRIPDKINLTYLCLIPKIFGVSTTSQFRPISLCNIIDKIITKIIVNRIKPLLPLTIGPIQASFLKKIDGQLIMQ